MIRKFFLFYIMFFSFFIFGFSEISGSYQDLLEYKIKGNKIYFTVYLDRINLKLNKVGKIGKEYFDYPTLYKYINSVQKKIGNPLLRNYVKMFLKNQIIIYTTFSVKDKSFKLPYYYAYILDSTMESTIHFDNSHNIRYMTSKLKNDYIDFYFSADNSLLRGKLDFKVNFLKVGSITFDGFNGGVVFSSFPVFHMDLKLKVSRVFCKMDGFNVWINNTFLHNLDDKMFVRVDSICLRRNDIDFVGIENLSFHIKNFKYDNFIFLALSTKNEILRVRFLDRNIKFYKLFFDADFFYSKDELNFYFRVLDWKRDTFDFDFSFLRKYDGFLPNLGKKILEYLQLLDSKHYKTTRDLFLTVNLSTNSFNIFNKNFMIRFWGNKIEFFDRFLWINLDNLKIITLLYENEFGFIDLSNKKLTYISKISGFSVFWDSGLEFFITDYKNGVLWDDGIMWANFEDVGHFFSCMPIKNNVLLNGILNTRFFTEINKLKGLKVLGVLRTKQSSVRILFSYEKILSFCSIDFNYYLSMKGGHLKADLFPNNLDSVLMFLIKAKYIGFVEYKEYSVLFSNREVFINFLNSFVYYRIDWDKIREMYYLLAGSGFVIDNILKSSVLGNLDNTSKNNLINFIDKNFSYLYSDIFLGNQLIFYSDSKFLIFLNGEDFLINYVNFFVRNDSKQLLKFFIPETNFGFNVQVGKGLIFYGNGIKKLSNFLVLDYKFKKIFGVRELLGIILNNEIAKNYYLLLNQVYRNLFFDFEVYLSGKRVIYGFGSKKSINFERYYLDLWVDLNREELYTISNTLGLNKDHINIINIIDVLKVRGLCEISQNSIRIYIEDSIFSLDYFLKFGIKVGGWIDLRVDHKKKNNLFVNSYNFDLEMLKNGGFKCGKIKLVSNSQGFNCNISLNNSFFDFINLVDFIYLGGGSQDNVLEFNLSSDSRIYYGDLRLNLYFKEILFKSYKLKDFYGDICVAFATSSLLESGSNFFDIFVNNLDKLFVEANFNVSYYVFIDEIYRKGLQNINVRLDKGVAILDGRINVSLKEILKFGNWDKEIKVRNEYFSDYWNQILSTGFVEIVFEKSRIGDLAGFLSSFLRDFSVKEFSINSKNIDFFADTKISLYFILFGYNYILDFEPNFDLKNGYYFLKSLKFTLFEGSEPISVIGFDYIKKRIDNIYFNKLPSFLGNLYEGNLAANLDFKNNVFNFYFDRFSFNWLSNRIFIDGGMILKDRGFVAPVLKVNGSNVSIGFDGNFISLVSEMKELDIGRFYYKGRIKTNLLVSTDIEDLAVYGNVDVYRGFMGYRKYKLSDSVVKIPVNLFLNFNSVRFRNTFADFIFSGNLRYISDKKILIGELRSRKGFVSLADGLYRILQGSWIFRSNILGDLYVVLQKMTSNPFDYKISIFKGNINNLSLEEFGSKTNIQNNDVISDRLSLTFFNTPLLDLVYLSSYGYTVQREVFPNVFVSYFSTYSGDKFSKLGYEWYYSIDWVISRFKLGIITANFRTYSGGRNSIGIVFVKGF